MPFDLPRTLTLPSGLRVTLRVLREGIDASSDAADDEIFADAIALFTSGRALIEAAGAKTTSIDVLDLSLADFHVVRGVVTKAALIDEDEVELDCHNCGELLVVAKPCAGLETGPWEDDEADDVELDALAPTDEALALEHPIALGRVRHARSVTFSPRTLRDLKPILKALHADPLVIDAVLVRAMGIQALGAEADPDRIARALEKCEAASFDEIADAFLAVHYPLRLACDVKCPKCDSRNTVDAPSVREFMQGDVEDDAEDDDERAKEARDVTALPTLEDFVEKAHSIADPLIREIPGTRVELVVESETPAVDDAGEPLLGSYVSPPPADAPVPMTPPTVTIYYRTFAAIEREEGSFDWEGELRETIEHELTHHIFFLRGGHDPMDDEEHREIDINVARVVGRSEVTRRSLLVFGLSIPDFFRRAWPLALIAALVLVITLAEGRCSRNHEPIEDDEIH